MNDIGSNLTTLYPALGGGAQSAGGPQSEVAVLEGYWREIRGARLLPARTSVDPGRIDAALPHSFILERVAPGIARFRVCGQAINALIGSEARGMPLSVLFSVQGRERLGHQLERVFNEPALVDLPVQAVRGLARPRLSGRLLLLPLESEDGSVNRALGAIFVEGMVGRTPRVFDIPDDGDRRYEPLIPMAARRAQSEGPALVQRPALRLVVNNA